MSLADKVAYASRVEQQRIKTEGEQRVDWYNTQNGRVYQRQQYHRGSWLSIGDCSENFELIDAQVEAHNLQAQLQRGHKT